MLPTTPPLLRARTISPAWMSRSQGVHEIFAQAIVTGDLALSITVSYMVGFQNCCVNDHHEKKCVACKNHATSLMVEVALHVNFLYML